MAVIDYEDGFARDTNVLAPNVYFDGKGGGQGCNTVWYKNVAAGRFAIKRNRGKPPDGTQAGLCEQCACHYSYGTAKHKKYPEFACRAWKAQWENG